MTTVEAQPVLGVSPVLDIGGDIGALVVYLPRSPDGGELEMEPVGDPAGRFHTGVHRRFALGGTTPLVAVFPEVRSAPTTCSTTTGAIPRGRAGRGGGRARRSLTAVDTYDRRRSRIGVLDLAILGEQQHFGDDLGGLGVVIGDGRKMRPGAGCRRGRRRSTHPGRRCTIPLPRCTEYSPSAPSITT